MNISAMTNDVRKKWKIYVIGYLLGYIIYIIYIIGNGTPTWHYYFPIKVQCFVMSLYLGFLFDDELIKSSHTKKKWKSLKFTVWITFLLVLSVMFKSLILLLTGYDISPLVGF